MNGPHSNGWKTFGMVILTILAVFGALSLFALASCMSMLSQCPFK
jgi:hypothetical protein